MRDVTNIELNSFGSGREIFAKLGTGRTLINHRVKCKEKGIAARGNF